MPIKSELKKLITDLDENYHLILKSKGGFDEYAIWASQYVERNPDQGLKVLRKTSIFKLVKDIKDLASLLPEKRSKNHLEDFELNRRKGEGFIFLVQEYFKIIDSGALGNRTFYFYFLDISRHKEPVLGRAVLKTSINKTATVENIKGPYSVDYEGFYSYLSDTVLFFDLQNPTGGSYSHTTNKRLHIKVRCDNPNLELLFGSYNTFDRGRIFTGSVVLKQLDEKEAQNPKPLTLSAWENREAFEKTDKNIRQYLSLKNRNYHKVPEHIPNTETLSEYLDNYNLMKNRNQKFLELRRPRIFIATPNSSLLTSNGNWDELQEDSATEENLELDKHSQQVKRIASSLIEEFPNNQIVYKDRLFDKKEGLENYEISDVDHHRPPRIGFKLLQRSRYFVLILPQTTKASLALVQLGWALSFTKNILLIYCKQSISHRLRALDGLGVEKKSYSDLEKDFDDVLIRIKRFIEDHKD